MTSLQGFNPLASLRILCGLFFIPHTWDKFFDKAGATKFFRAAKLPTAVWWFVGLAALEIIFTLGLVFNLYTRWIAWVAAIYLLVAAYYDWKVSKHKWNWLAGGAEFATFWCLVCVILALAY